MSKTCNEKYILPGLVSYRENFDEHTSISLILNNFQKLEEAIDIKT